MGKKNIPQLKVRRFWKTKPFERIKKSDKVYSRNKDAQRPAHDVEEESEARVLGLDVGDKRIGVAISDPLGITAQPLGVIDAERGMEELKELMPKHEIELIVVGHPLTLKGERGERARSVEEFARNLESATGVPFTLVDERLSTKAAERIMREMGRKPSREKGRVDELAAVIILQSYLDRKAMSKYEDSDEDA
jgi:putative Holliday junction resolvase